MLEEALERVESGGDARAARIVLDGDGWHPGVVGIVASRVVERFGRPTFLIAFDGEIGRGSGRSISRFDLHAALGECHELLERYGGHHMAAGLTIRRERLEAFRARFADVARRTLAPEDLGPEQRVDLEIRLSEATPELERLAATSSPPARAIRRRCSVSAARGSRAGASWAAGISRACSRTATARLAAIGFQWADRAAGLGDGPVDAAFRLETNEWQGISTLQARLLRDRAERAARAPAGPRCPPD